MNNKSSFQHLLALNTFIYISTALYSPFLSAYYAQNGLTTGQIGILSILGSFSALFVQPLWAMKADKTGKPKTVSIIVVLGLALGLMTYYSGTGFWNFFCATAVCTLFSTALIPLIDSIVVRKAQEQDYNYALIRMGGTIGYAVIVLIIGNFLRSKPSMSFALAATSYVFLAFLLTRLPASENHQPITEGTRTRRFNFALDEIFEDREVIYLLFFVFIYQLGMSFYGSFLGVYVVSIGYGQGEIGILNFIQACSEIPVLLLIHKMSKKYGEIRLIAAATILMGIRLILTAGGTLPMFMITQAMHGITFMVVHFNGVTYMAKHARVGKASEGQAIMYLIQTGIASVLGNTLGGRLCDVIGIKTGYIVVGCMTFVFGIIFAVCFRIHEKKKQKFV